MSFKLWTPGRAPGVDANYHPSVVCNDCNGTGEEDYKYVRGCGFSHIPCEKCKGSGRRKVDTRPNIEPVGS